MLIQKAKGVLLIGLASAMVLAIGCGKSESASKSPTEVFQSLQQAMKNQNIKAIKKHISSRSLKEMKKQAAKKDKTLEELMGRASRWFPTDVPVVDEKIDGKKANLKFEKETKKGNTAMTIKGTVKMVKEEGNWKFDDIKTDYGSSTGSK